MSLRSKEHQQRSSNNNIAPLRTSLYDEDEEDEHHQLLDAAISRLEADVWCVSLSDEEQNLPHRKSQEQATNDGGNKNKSKNKSIMKQSLPQEYIPDHSILVATVDDLIQKIEPIYHIPIIFAAGLSYMSDAIEIVATYFLAIRFHKDLDDNDHNNSTTWQSACVASSVFMGLLVGHTMLHLLCSSGRRSMRTMFCITAILRPIVGCLSVMVATDYPTTVALRFLVGMMASGRMVAFSILDEYCTSQRPNVWIYIQFFWSGGVIIVPIIEVMTDVSWQTLIFYAEFFVLIGSILSVMWLPESPSWLLERGRVEDTLLLIGNRCGQDFDWLVAIQPNPPPPTMTHAMVLQRWRLWGTWYGFAVLYFGAKYLINNIFYGQFEYDGMIVVSAELGVFGIFFGWFGLLRIGAGWTQVIGFFTGGTCITLLAAFSDSPYCRVVFAVLGPVGLVAGITASMSYAYTVGLVTPTAWGILLFGGVGAPFFMDDASHPALKIVWLVLQTVIITLCSWYVPNHGIQETRPKDATTVFL